jgi:CHRD domain
MLRCGWVVAAVAFGFLTTTSARGANFVFDLKGNGGDGLLGSNQNPVVTGGGSGGETAPGISYDDVSNILTIHARWGSGSGFTNLTGNATAGHLHGPTSPPPGGYNDNAGVDVPLDSVAGWNPSATSGGFDGTVTLSALQETRLLASEYYMNVHTAVNGNGEIRGQLVVVPEPATATLLLCGSGLALRRRRRS